MKRFEDRISIQAPADRVFEYVADFTRHREWAGHGLEVTKSTEGPVHVGTTFSTTAKLFGTQREQSMITEITPNETFAWDSTGALGRVHHWFSLDEAGGSTTLTKGAEMVDPTLLAKVTGWKLSRDIPKGLHNDLANIKTRVEGSAAA
ncbi:MAG TPA: SRPBCC family protein [Actinomycetota bacterium]|nr:SRPBCC family protein [Actinomycetota bacterium]